MTVLLVAAVALSFGLSIVAQSTTDARISRSENESARTFNAAEAGIEKALENLAAGSGTIPNVGGLAVNYDVSSQNYLDGNYKENETAQVILGSHPASAAVSITCAAPADLEIITINKSNYEVKKAIQACDSNAQCFALTDRFEWLMRLRPLGSGTDIRVIGESYDLPPQIYQVDSRAQSPTLETKAIQVTRTEPALPPIFDYVLFSGSSLVQ